MDNCNELNIVNREFSTKIDLSNIPILDIKNRRGLTDYIDFLTWDEVTNSIMTGTDFLGRRFIVIKMIINNEKRMETFFQRYYNDLGTWQICGHTTPRVFSSTGGMNESQANFLKDMVEKGKTVLQEGHRHRIPKLNGKIITLYT
jgi:hypothetical protein